MKNQTIKKCYIGVCLFLALNFCASSYAQSKFEAALFNRTAGDVWYRLIGDHSGLTTPSSNPIQYIDALYVHRTDWFKSKTYAIEFDGHGYKGGPDQYLCTITLKATNRGVYVKDIQNSDVGECDSSSPRKTFIELYIKMEE